MFKQVMVSVLAILGLLMSGPAMASDEKFDMQKYVDGCSPKGLIYASCDPWFWESGAITQEDIFNAAKKVADQQNKLLFVFLGHDACSFCHRFNYVLNNGAARQEFHRNFVVVKINTSTTSGKALGKKIGWGNKLVGVPAAMVYYQGELQNESPIYLGKYIYQQQPLLDLMKDLGLGKAE